MDDLSDSKNLLGETRQRLLLPDGLKPYYADEAAGIYIIHGDCREILPHLPRVELVLTDPPYGVQLNVKTQSSARGRHTCKGFQGHEMTKDWIEIKGDDQPFDPSFLLSFPKIILWGGIYYQAVLPTQSRWLVWDKRCGSASDDNADCEFAWTNLKGQARIFSHYWRGFLRAGEENLSVGGPKLHPTQKPLRLMKWCIDLAGTPQCILDPFMGSGTTLRAAKDLGRQAIGIEIEEKYCEIAVNRLRQEVLPLA